MAILFQKSMPGDGPKGACGGVNGVSGPVIRLSTDLLIRYTIESCRHKSNPSSFTVMLTNPHRKQQNAAHKDYYSSYGSHHYGRELVIQLSTIQRIEGFEACSSIFMLCYCC
ncbi:hypothetical protein V6N11_048303 [Hibiscus sabdariffa]|uniref:Uncharacterized protein n=1 Tax=Hibiscus sabdariffa TaxID=183260 RepID=A0ABR2PUT0_9ROSI